MRVFKRMFCKLTVLLKTPDFSRGPQRLIVSIIRSRVREMSPTGPRGLSFGFRRELSVFRQRYA